MAVRINRVYADPGPEDGARILADRLWPRDVSKEEATVDDWTNAVSLRRHSSVVRPQPGVVSSVHT